MSRGKRESHKRVCSQEHVVSLGLLMITDMKIMAIKRLVLLVWDV